MRHLHDNGRCFGKQIHEERLLLLLLLDRLGGWVRIVLVLVVYNGSEFDPQQHVWKGQESMGELGHGHASPMTVIVKQTGPIDGRWSQTRGKGGQLLLVAAVLVGRRRGGYRSRVGGGGRWLW